MPALPTLNVTDAQAQRLLAVFGSTAAYKQWLKETLIEYVVSREWSESMNGFVEEQSAVAEAKRAELLDGAS